jgi:hypothetical protein
MLDQSIQFSQSGGCGSDMVSRKQREVDVCSCAAIARNLVCTIVFLAGGSCLPYPYAGEKCGRFSNQFKTARDEGW